MKILLCFGICFAICFAGVEAACKDNLKIDLQYKGVNHKCPGYVKKRPEACSSFIANVCCESCANIKIEQNQEYVVELFYVIDQAAVNQYMSYGYDEMTAKKNLKADIYQYTQTANALYRTMNTSSDGVNIQLAPLKWYFMPDNKYVGVKNNVELLTVFNKWILNLEPGIRPKNSDAEILFTGLDLGKEESGSDVFGVAWHLSACQRDRQQAVVKVLRTSRTAGVLAHEIGAMLGADNDRGACIDEKATMSSYLYSGGRTYFSTCSKRAIKSHIGYLRSLYRNCLHNTTITFKPKPPPADLVNVTKACQRSFGPNARQDPPFLKSIKENICDRLNCRVGTTSGSRRSKAADGTVCDTGKICLLRQCVPKSQAPWEAW